MLIYRTILVFPDPGGASVPRTSHVECPRQDESSTALVPIRVTDASPPHGLIRSATFAEVFTLYASTTTVVGCAAAPVSLPFLVM